MMVVVESPAVVAAVPAAVVVVVPAAALALLLLQPLRPPPQLWQPSSWLPADRNLNAISPRIHFGEVRCYRGKKNTEAKSDKKDDIHQNHHYHNMAQNPSGH